MNFFTKFYRSYQKHAKKNGFARDLDLLEFTVWLTSNELNLSTRDKKTTT